MKSVETDDALDTLILELNTPAVKFQKLWRWFWAEYRLPLVEFLPHAQRGGRNIEGDNATTQLRKKPCRPTAAGAKFQNGHSRAKTKSLKNDREVNQQLRHFID